MLFWLERLPLLLQWFLKFPSYAPERDQGESLFLAAVLRCFHGGRRDRDALSCENMWAKRCWLKSDNYFSTSGLSAEAHYVGKIHNYTKRANNVAPIGLYK